MQKLSLFFDFASKAALLQLPTGAGKSRTTISAPLELYQQHHDLGGVLWMAHTEELCEQALQTFRYIWRQDGPFEIRCGRFWGAFRTNIYELFGQFTFAGYQKMLALAKSDDARLREFLESIRVVVIDEAHKGLGPETAKLIRRMKEFPKYPGFRFDCDTGKRHCIAWRKRAARCVI